MPKDIEYPDHPAQRAIQLSLTDLALVAGDYLPDWLESFFLPAGEALLLPETESTTESRVPLRSEAETRVVAELQAEEEEGDARAALAMPALLTLVTAEVKGMERLADVPVATFATESPPLADTPAMAALPMMPSCICSFCGETATGGYPAASSPFENGSNSGIVIVGATGTATLNGVIWGSRWNGSISYVDPDSSTDYQPGYFTGGVVDGYQAGFSQLSAAQLKVVHTALNEAIYTQDPGALGLSVEAFTGLSISYGTSGTGTSTIRLANTSPGNLSTARVADFPEANIWGGDVWFGGSGQTGLVAGTYDWHTVIHELGHALGLKHGHDDFNRNGSGAAVLPASTDSMEYSVMTYRSYVGQSLGGGYTNEQYGYAQTWMMYDIAALQFLYGADYGANSGNTTYTWSPGSGNTVINGQVAIAPGGNRIFATIWDGGGIDTYDLSAYSTDLTINLAPGGFSVFSAAQLADLDQFSSNSSRIARGNIFNALLFNGNTASLIENAIGGSGDDVITGNSIANTLYGGSGIDSLFGGNGNDVIYGGFSEDSVFGGAGNDTFVNRFGEFAENVYGGTGNDTLDSSGRTDNRAVSVNELLARYFLTPGVGPDYEYDLVSVERYIGTIYGDTMRSGGNGNTFFGGSGDDTMIAGAGGETMFGGAGNDTLDLSVGNFIYTFDTQTGESAEYDDFEDFAGFETYIFGEDNDRITTHAALGEEETVLGGAGNDTIIDRTGTSSTDIDSYNGGAGIDLIEFNNGSLTTFTVINLLAGRVRFSGADRDHVVGFENARVVNNSAGIIGTNGDNLLSAVGAGTNSIAGLAGNDEMLGDGGNDSLDGGIGNDILYGGVGRDQASGGNGNDSLFGEAGDDILIGSFGVDYMDGGAGNDVYYYENLGDVIVEDGAADTADRILSSISANIALIDLDIENMTLTGTGDINGVGSNISNEIVGNTGNNQLTGNGGNDVLKGGDGNDILNGNDGDDLLVGGNGNDSLIGQIGNDRLEGGAGNDSMAGFGGNDSFIGGAGNDRLDGGAGNDRLSGGTEADTFVFAGNWGVDLVTDFSTATVGERIDLSSAPGIVSFADLTANHLTQAGANAVITSGANTITLVAVNIALLNADDFIF